MTCAREVSDSDDAVTTQVRSRASGDRLEVKFEAERLGDLHDGRKARVAIAGQRLVEPLAAHASAASEFADVAGTGDGSKRLRNEGWVIPTFLEGGLQVCSSILHADEVVGTVIGA